MFLAGLARQVRSEDRGNFVSIQLQMTCRTQQSQSQSGRQRRPNEGDPTKSSRFDLRIGKLLSNLQMLDCRESD